MGIPGLIHAIGAGERISLSKLAITHLQRTHRPIRVAVDISIWLFQVQAGRGGRNPELRTLFYRLLKILALPIHPLFVYDGKNKPPFKRGKAVSGRSYGSAPIIRLSKILVDLFRFPRHEAPGEAEAECAKLQRTGVVDAVMSNDVDALMFGSTFTIMNFSKESGSGTAAATHVTCYSMDGSGEPSRVMLDRAGMILFAMLSGGDYLPSGVPKCGSKLAGEIAKAGFGADLLEILDSEGDELDTKLGEWRERLQYELEENESGYFQTKHKVVRVPETFPDRTLLSYYAKPVVSKTRDIEALQERLVDAWDKEIDVVELRRFTADSFEWNYRSGARKVTRLLAEPLISYRLRLGRQASAFPQNSPRLSNSNVPMLQKVYKSRSSYSTDGMTEIQVDMIPVDVVGFDILSDEPNPPLPSQESTVSGDEEEEEPENNAEPVLQSPTKKRVTKRYDPYASEKLWVFETLATIGIPEVVANWKKEQAEKAAPKKPTARKTGPRKKGPIDPGMKRGSILKYGTLTKERSEISGQKSAQLLEAAISAKSPAEPSLSNYISID
ncbi:exonuclease [Aspergillus heteromorphus CBS 117.55]|uniref:Exonuclease n=1 Tax=Aspergillus heteromorphus CBS 117.55 TaxID=1448321 RepID=A0A317X380_9EURO|nr:exonuclease [Aspergillus heteromorphus CBS 117.55]PWY92082.1 exonuclease [Aspergillus heteromorphus CBS 117.55]